MEKGYLSIVLHAHLPFVRHPEYGDFLEEDWLYEALTETYIPLIQMMEGLVRERVPFRLTMSLTPTLVSMMIDPLLQDRYSAKLDRLVELSAKEIERTRWQPEFNRLAECYHRKFSRTRDLFINTYNKNVVQEFKHFQDLGHLEIITSAATHAFLPLLNKNVSAIRAQIRVGVAQYERLFGRKPQGIWLPECGYEPGLDELLKESGIRYFIVDSHGILHASPRPRYGVFAPIYCPSRVAAFGRDIESSRQVWSAREGYPGDYDYRDFYRDIGFDLDYDYIRPYLHEDGIRVYTGIKYYRITGDAPDKAPYNPDAAREKAAVHAGNFMVNRKQQIEFLYNALGKRPIIVAPYDAELFGHWWYEGPYWLDFLIRKAAGEQTVFQMITPSEYLERYPDNQVAVPSLSSWGWKGYNEVWLEGSNDWIYRHLHKAAEWMVDLAKIFPHAEGVVLRALNQAVRELLLAQSSDWAFIMKTGTMASYAMQRTRTHIINFMRIREGILKNNIDETWLLDLESRDNIFPDIDYRIYV